MIDNVQYHRNVALYGSCCNSSLASSCYSASNWLIFSRAAVIANQSAPERRLGEGGTPWGAVLDVLDAILRFWYDSSCIVPRCGKTYRPGGIFVVGSRAKPAI